MPQPSAGQLHVDTYLTTMAVAWAQDENNFVAGKVFPIVPVLKESDLYAIYDIGYFYRTGQMRPRPLGGRPPSTGYETTSGRYSCVEWGLEHPIDDRVRQNADMPLDPDLAGMRLLTSQTMIQREGLWASKFFQTGVWGTDWQGEASGPTGNQFLQWDQAGSDPIQFIRGRRNDVASRTGYRPNKVVFGATAFEAFLNHPLVVDRVKFTQGPAAYYDDAEATIAKLLGVDEVLIPFGVSNTAAEGQTDAISFMVDPISVLLVYAAPAPTIDTPSGGYTFAYTGLIPGVMNAFGGVIERGREELAHSDILQIRGSYDQEVVASSLGEFFHQVVSSDYSESTF